MKLKLVILITFIGSTLFAQSQQKSYTIHTVGLYNLENLFDKHRDERNYDEELTPKGNRSWDGKKYRQKIANLSRAISEIGTDENTNMPTILGVSEVENRGVLEDL